jgi:Cu(I)/Ag(I) efflux system membrane fusion protein
MKERNAGNAAGRLLAGLVLLALGAAMGWYFAAHLQVSESMESAGTGTRQEAKLDEAEPEILYWVAPMDPNYRRDKPGKSPMGMDLVPVYAEHDSDAGEDTDSIRIEPAVEHNLGVRRQAAAVRPLWRRIEATGYVGFDEDRMIRMHLRTSGWVERLAVDAEGERVKKGQLLFEFYSPELVNAQKEYLQERRRGEQGLLRAAAEKLRALGMPESEIGRLDERGTASRTVSMFAPMAGIVTSLHAREGIYLKPEMEVLSLADLSTVWMQAEIFEAQADWVAEGQAAEARLGYLPGEVFAGRVDYVYPVLDPMTRTLRVRLQFDNPGERLKPNMYATVTIFGSTHQDALTIPREALIRAAGNDRVIVALGKGRYRSQEVMTGIESGEWIQIIAGLEAGQEVVTSAQFLIDSEASLSGSIRRLEDAAETDARKRSRNVFGSGLVERLDRGRRELVIRHGPIDALGWPGMTMQFDVTPAVDLDRVQVGQNVHFSIRPDEQGVYLVDMIHLVDSDREKVGDGRGGDGQGDEAHRGMDHD